MRLNYRISLPWVAAALFACALPAAPDVRAYANPETASLLASQLPEGTKLKQASVDQVGDALYAAATQRPDLAISLLHIGIIAKRPPKHGNLPCPDLIKLLRKTAAAVPDQARQLVELAISLDPECTDELNAVLDDPTLIGLNFNAFGGTFGFGLGGGTVQTVGSPPGGTAALPPASAQGAMTPDT